MLATNLQPSAGFASGLRRGAAVRDGWRAAWRRLVAIRREWRRRSRERAELARLDDRALLDIGLTRADAEFLAAKPFWRE